MTEARDVGRVIVANAWVGPIAKHLVARDWDGLYISTAGSFVYMLNAL